MEGKSGIYDIRELRRLFRRRYGRRNKLYLQGLMERIHFLLIVIGDLHDAVRKKSFSCSPTAFARVVSGIFGVADHFDMDALPLEQMMVRKYPEKCAYCGSAPCLCTERRGEAVLAPSVVNAQTNWTLKEWSEHLSKLYGERNAQSGIDNVIARLLKEAVEILSLQIAASHTHMPSDELENEFALELSDVLAWTLGAANLLQVDLEKAIRERYEIACPDCREPDCTCTKFDMRPMDWALVKTERVA